MRTSIKVPVLFGGLTYPQRIKAIFGSNLIGYWPMNEITGTVAIDASGNARNGTYTGVELANAAAPAKIGGFAPKFDGVNDLLDVHSAGLAAAFNSGEGTLAIWAKVFNVGVWTDNGYRTMMIAFTDANNRALLIKMDASGSNQFNGTYVAGSTAENMSTATTTIAWMHAALTWSKSNERAITYLNGVALTPSTTLGTWSGAIAKAVIGSYNTTPTYQWYGWLCHAAIISREATAAEILTMYNLGV